MNMEVLKPALGYNNGIFSFPCSVYLTTVAGSIPDGVIEIFRSHNPSGRTIGLGSTRPQTEVSTRNTSCEVKAAGA